MSNAVLYMSMSVDGFIAGPDDGPDNGIGDGGGRLHELHIRLVPVLLGQGRRLFEDMPPEHTELEPARVFGGPGVQRLRYRVRQAG